MNSNLFFHRRQNGSLVNYRGALSVLLSFFLLLLLSSSVLSYDRKETIRIGVFLPMTGVVSSYGQSEWAGIKVARDLLPTVLGRNIELILIDDKSDRFEALKAVDHLINKYKVHAIIGSSTSRNTSAGAELAERAGIPLISPSATESKLTANKKYIFRVCPLDSFQAQIAAKYSYDFLKTRRAALLIDIANASSVDLAKEFKKNFVQRGGKIVQTTYCQSGDRDFTLQLTAIMESDPDILYIPNYYTENALISKQASAVGYKGIIMAADGAQSPELISMGGKSVEGLLLTGHFSANAVTSDLGRRYLQRYAKVTRLEIGAYEALGADAYFILVQAIDHAKSSAGTRIRAALASTRNFEGVSGNIKFSESGNSLKSMVVLQVLGGKFQYLSTLHP
jgi:branched-chain amino acid transport system substrate-binding protein